MSKSVKDRKGLSFREAEGLLSPPGALKWGELDYDLRIDLWDNIYVFLHNGLSPPYSLRFYPDIEATLIHIFRRVFRHALDEATRMAQLPDTATRIVKEAILNADYGVCLEVVQELLRRRADDEPLCRAIGKVFEQPRSPYLLVYDPPTFVPRGLVGEGQVVATALTEIEASGATGAKSHLLLATDALNKRDWRGAVRESIHAVESAAKKLTGKSNATLSDALTLLASNKPIHPALRDAMKKLYAYSSDENGIRHALLEGDNDNVGPDEAIFMYVSCAAFVSFMLRKSGAAEIAE